MPSHLEYVKYNVDTRPTSIGKSNNSDIHRNYPKLIDQLTTDESNTHIWSCPTILHIIKNVLKHRRLLLHSIEAESNLAT